MSEKGEADKKVEGLKVEIKSLSSKLKTLGNTKEEKYKEKTSVEQQLNNLIKEANILKETKKEIDDEIRALKSTRDSKNTEVKKTMDGLKKSADELKKVRSKTDYVSPARLRKQVNDLEFSLQTTVISFNKEKKIMKQIKTLKARIKEIEKEETGFKSLRINKEESRKLKKDADDIHKKIQTLAKQSSEIFIELTNKSKEIQDIKAQRNTLQLVLRGLKSEINNLNRSLSKILGDWSKVARNVIGKKRERMDELLTKKTEDVKQKLKDKKKLTTEDILVLQREAMRG